MSDTVAHFEDRKRRRKLLLLNDQDLKTLLGLPKDVSVVFVGSDLRMECVVVGIVSDRFEKVPDYVEPPIVQKEVEYVECNQGLLHIKYDLKGDEE